jgi:hypothetical protein
MGQEDSDRVSRRVLAGVPDRRKCDRSKPLRGYRTEGGEVDWGNCGIN